MQSKSSDYFIVCLQSVDSNYLIFLSGLWQKSYRKRIVITYTDDCLLLLIKRQVVVLQEHT